uniref:Uncharacterized protein n=1 Tax=Arundo donax TaxID=35708 RepID=A0A0A9B0F7_ARUDO
MRASVCPFLRISQLSFSFVPMRPSHACSLCLIYS